MRRWASQFAAGLIAIVAAISVPSVAAASPSTPHRPTPPAHVTAGRVIVLRPHRADLLMDQRLVRSVPLPSATIGLAGLALAIGDPIWIAFDRDGGLTLHAGLAQRPGTHLFIGSPVSVVRLADSPTSPAYLSGTGATLTLSHVIVTSTNGATDAVDSSHRPYLQYLHNSAVSVTNTTFRALGRSNGGLSGVTVAGNSALAVRSSVFTGSSAGLEVRDGARTALIGVRATGNTGAGIVLRGASKATFFRVTASGNGGDGLHLTHSGYLVLTGVQANNNTSNGVVLRDAAAATLSGVRAASNTGAGVILSGPITALAVKAPIAANRNHAMGVVLTGLPATPIGPLRTAYNQLGGVTLRGCPGCVIHDVAAAGERTGVTVDQQSPNAVLTGATVTQATAYGVLVAASGVQLRGMAVSVEAGGVGMRIRGAAADVAIHSGTATGGAVGVSADGNRTSINDVTVTDAAVGVRIGGYADDVRLDQVHVRGTETGVLTTAGVGRVTVSNGSVVQHSGAGVRSGAAQLSVTGLHVSGAHIGMDLAGAATVRNSELLDVAEAVNARRESRVQLTDDVLSATQLGIRSAAGYPVTVAHSTVSAPLGGRGPLELRDHTRFPPLRLNWLGVVALIAIAAAITLEILRWVREARRRPRARVAAHVTNIA